MKRTLLLIIVTALLVPVIAVADASLVRFKGGIGVIPVSSGVGLAATAEVVTRNIVRGVQPAGQIWRIADLRADVRTDGQITVKGEGLLLAGGNGIGTNANASVFATLICEAVAPFVERNTELAGVPLESNGDFRIDDLLSPAPEGCASPVLLIRNASNQAWFAAGIPE
jgi:hypothetical protein